MTLPKYRNTAHGDFRAGLAIGLVWGGMLGIMLAFGVLAALI